MEKPPFQFGLKAAFLVTIGAAVFASLGVPPEAAKSGAALAVIAALAFVAVLSLTVFVAFALSVSMTLYHLIGLCRQLWSKPDTPALHCSRTSQILLPPPAAKR
jgi:hypothetical protein